MEQKRTAPRAQKTQPLTYREWKRRKQLRLARNWGLFLAGCALVVFLLTKGILWLLPHLHGADGPQTFAASAYDSTDYLFDADDARLAGIAAARTQLVRQRDAVLDERRNGIGMAVVGGLVALFCGRRPFGLFGVVAAIAPTAAIWGIVQVVSSQRSIATLNEHIDELNKEERRIAQEMEEE